MAVHRKKLLRSTLADADMMKHEVDYLEAHGTGTALGDPIEMSSAASVFGEDRNSDCPLFHGRGEGKHWASGNLPQGLPVFIKTVLVLRHEMAPSNPELKNSEPKH